MDWLTTTRPAPTHEKRWQDVAQLLKAGISVITSVNLQHIEEKREKVEAITGKHVTDTVPLSFLQTADEIVVVDAPPENCMGAAADRQAQADTTSAIRVARDRVVAGRRRGR